MPNLSPNTLIPPSLKDIWLPNSKIAFGIFDQQWLPAYPMNQSTFQSAITNGLNYADQIVWTYAENDYVTPGGVNQSWINAIWNARNAAGILAPGANKGTSGIVGNAPSVSNVQVTNVTKTPATIFWKVVSGLETSNHDRILADWKVLPGPMGQETSISSNEPKGTREDGCLGGCRQNTIYWSEQLPRRRTRKGAESDVQILHSL